MTAALLAMLPFALGVTMSGTAMLALLRLLARPRWKAPGIAFTIGAATAVAILSGIAFGVVRSAGVIPERTRAWLTVILGTGMLVFASRAWWRHRTRERRRRRDHREIENPIQAAGMGAFLVGVNAKNIALTVSAATVLHAFRLQLVQLAIAGAVFVVVGVLGVTLPLVVRWTADHWMEPTMKRVNAISARGAPFAIAAMAVVATFLIVTGVRGLGHPA